MTIGIAESQPTAKLKPRALCRGSFDLNAVDNRSHTALQIAADQNDAEAYNFFQTTPLLDAETSTAKWAIFEIIAGAGLGVVINTLLPACQAGHAECDQAAVTATWSFLRSFGNIWGVGISCAIFNNWFDQLSGWIPDPVVREALSRVRAYEYSSSSFLRVLDPVLQRIVVGVYVDSLKMVWEIAVVFAGVAFLLVFLEKEVPLRTNLETEVRLELGESRHGGGRVDEASSSTCALIDNEH
ncbi:hypothetical protein BJX62DRAFT_244387 [Aspergillus germanicus]